jgi:hypothetical protein
MTSKASLEEEAEQALTDAAVPYNTPAANLLTPYAIGNIEVMVPMWVRLKPSVGSATMAGALYVRLPRVK